MKNYKKMKKIIMSIKKFIWSLFCKNKDKRTHVLTYEELVKALDKGKKEIVLDKDISCAAPLQIDSEVTIDGNGHRIYCRQERQGFALNEDTFYSPLHFAKSRMEHEDGTEVKLSEKEGGIFRVATHISQDEVERYQYINFSCGWTAYTLPIIKYENGYIYFRSYGTDYCVDFDWYQGNSKKFTEYRLIYCGEKQYSKYILSLKSGAKVEMKNMELRGGITVSPKANLRLDKCSVMYCTECGINAQDKTNLVVVDCYFCRTWKSAIKSKGSIYVRDTDFFNVNKGRQNTGAIDCEGDTVVIDTNLCNYGSLGIRVGKVKAVTEDECPSVLVISNTLDGSLVNQGVVTDTGAIYLAANSSFATIKNNVIAGYEGRGNNHAIYCDDGAYNFEVSGNKITNCPTGYAISSRCADPSKTPRGYAGGEPNTNRLIADNYCESGVWFGGNAEVADNKCVYKNNVVHENTKYKTKLSNVKIINDKN